MNQKSMMSGSSSSPQNMAFVSSSNNNTSSFNKAVNVAHGVTTASTQVNTAYSTNIDNLSDVVICSFFASQPNSPQLAHEDWQQIHPDDIEEMYLRWQMAMLTMRARSLRRSVPVETSTSTALVSCDGLCGYDWSDLAEEGPNYALMAYSSSSSDIKLSNDSNCSKFCMETVKLLKSQNDQLLRDLEKSSFMVLECQIVNKHVVENRKSDEEVSKVVRKSDDSPIIKDWASDSEEENVSQTKTEKKTVKPSIVKKDFDKSKQQQKLLGKLLNNFDHLQVDCNYHPKLFQNQRMVKHVWNNAQRVNHQNFAKKTHPCAKKNLVLRAVLMKSGLVSVNTAHSKTTVNAARLMHMAGNMSYLINYEEIDGGYVAFGGNPKGGKIAEKVKKSVRLMMEKLFGMELELILVTQS
ncbi:hypothetical protein Tco_1025203 [Tanacetum coccineum]